MKNTLKTILIVLVTMFMVQHIWLLVFLAWPFIGYLGYISDDTESRASLKWHLIAGPFTWLPEGVEKITYKRAFSNLSKIFFNKEFDIKLQWPIVIKEKTNK